MIGQPKRLAVAVIVSESTIMRREELNQAISLTSTCVLAIVSVAQATKAKEPEIILPVPQVEPERPGPEVPPDNDAPERESPSRAGKGAIAWN